VAPRLGRRDEEKTMAVIAIDHKRCREAVAVDREEQPC